MGAFFVLLRLAARNLMRNKRRTFITMTGISMGLALLIFSSGMGDGMHNQLIDRGVGAMAGHVVVQAEGWQQDRKADQVVPDATATAATLQALVPDAQVLSRVFLQGLLTSPSGSAGVSFSAVQPDREPEVNELARKVADGAWLESDRDVVLGATLLDTLGVGLGDKVVLLFQQDGEMESRLFRVRGVFRSGVDIIDGFTAYITLPAGQELLGVQDAVTQISLHLPEQERTEPTTAAVGAALAGRAGVEVLGWRDAMPDLHQYVVLDDAGLYVLILIIAFIVLLGILNTVLMSVLERVREFGVMLALGTTPLRLTTMVLLEGLLLGALGSVLGVLLGLAANYPVQTRGLDFRQFYGGEQMDVAGVPMDMMVYADLSPEKVLLFVALSMGLTVLSALYPAWKAGRLRPVQAIAHR